MPDVTRKETKPPIAILAYTDSLPVRTLVYPLARYSPEYQAICWAHEHDVPVEFIDLPSDIFLGLQDRGDRAAARRSAERRAPSRGRAAGTRVGVPEPRPSLYEQIADWPASATTTRTGNATSSTTRTPDSYRGAAYELGRALRELEEDAPALAGGEPGPRGLHAPPDRGGASPAGIKPEQIVAVVGAFHAPVLTGEFPAMTDAGTGVAARAGRAS